MSTDASGQVSWKPDQNVVEILTLKAHGFADTTPAALNDNPVIQLQGSASVEGNMTKHGKPVAGRNLALERQGKRTGERSRFRWETEPVTDASGRFAFPQAPPGVFSLIYHSPVPGQPQTFGHVPLQELVIRPGETNIVNYDDGAVEVTAHLVWPADFPRDPKQQVYAVIHRAFPSESTELMSNPEILANAGNWMLQEKPGNLWKNSDVASGNYLLDAVVTIPGDEGKPGTVVLQAQLNVSIDPASTEETLNLGDIILERSTRRQRLRSDH